MIKKTLQSLMILSMGYGFQSINADLPEGWLEQAQRLISSSSEMKEVLDWEADLIKTYHGKVTASFALIKANQDLRDATFHCVRERYNAVAAAVVACQADTTSIVEEGTDKINALLAELRGLKKSTDAQITELITQKHTLTEEFATWKRHFEEDLGEYAEHAETILTSLKDVSESFNRSITERQSFTTSIDDLIATMHLDTKTELTDTYDLKTDLCTNAPEIQPMPGYDPVIYDPIPCPSEEFIAEEGQLPEA